MLGALRSVLFRHKIESQPAPQEIPQPVPVAEPVVKQQSGYCPCCRNEVIFSSPREWLRDFYACQSCGSVPRQRHINAALDDLFPGWESKVIHESSPSGDFVARHAQHYSSSQYMSDAAPGSEVNGVRCENIEALTFADESVDLFVTQDVMEHVFDPGQALREIHRVLRPGGAYVFTAPTHVTLSASICRAQLRNDGSIEHLLPEAYHGNPVGDGRALVTWDYGMDAQHLFSEWSGSRVEVYDDPDPARGIEAELLRVYVVRK
ncbi:class I SAM-dependent methyltransferase [Burkholderia vietnamiensis]|uniref:class I SAM-dependent methyltransferase n=1 Tax=Burkholderia vietnamiensis TaxID=60552 RepID=UPI0018DC1694|nr:class I SAM-dependent methyltransferase [Burkholderia vietnamiensis]MBH9645036.1 class I SAM-dependent methyltransferase [Burkholderia vietnamiensis]